MVPVAAYCETPLQTRIAAAIAGACGDPSHFTLLLGAWSDDVGQREAARASGLKTHDLTEADPHAPLSARWRAVRDAVGEYLSGGRRLLMFQDQHFFAQAAAAGARKAAAPYDLVQDGYLDFDMTRVPAAKRALWPLARMIDARGPVRPSPRIRPLAYRELYLSHFFGHTRADRTFVFGQSMAARLHRQFGIPPERIVVSGPPLACAPPPAQPRPLREQGRMSVLFFDQCFLRYRRMRPEGWRRDYLAVIGTLADYGADVKLHPAQTEDCVRDIRAAMGGKGAILGREPAGGAHLDGADIAVTASSSSFLLCLEAGVPVIFIDLPSSFDRMPRIKSALLRNVAGTAELRCALESRRMDGFASNADGAPLSDYIDYGGGGAALIARLVLEA